MTGRTVYGDVPSQCPSRPPGLARDISMILLRGKELQDSSLFTAWYLGCGRSEGDRTNRSSIEIDGVH
jgi:hypothetical protein